MTTFNDRERAFENKYAHDAEMQFKAIARSATRNWACGAAGLLGKTGDAVEALCHGRESAPIFEEEGHEDVFRKVAADLADQSGRSHDPRQDGGTAGRGKGGTGRRLRPSRSARAVCV